MCLASLTDWFPVGKEKGLSVGWKIFLEDSSGGLRPEICGREEYPKEKWIKAESFGYSKYGKTALYAGKKPYRAGFHIFVFRGDAEAWWDTSIIGTIIKKVYFRKIVEYGYQEMKKVVVAKEMFIPEKD